MKRAVYLSVAALVFLLALSCSSDGRNPIVPASDQDLTNPATHAGQTQTHLWGYWDVTIDVENGTVEAVPIRDAMFAANVVTFLNGKLTTLQFQIINIQTQPSYTDVLIDVRLTHPFPGLPAYNGYDVRGIFIGDNSDQLDYGFSLGYAVDGTDQYMSNPDGYTRWYNPGEFIHPGVLGYTPGDYASPGYKGSAAVNPYKYFANGLSATGDVWNFLTSTTNDGVFSSGSTNARRYDLRFPNSTGVRYNYSVVANWEGELPSHHPSNALECVGADIEITDDIWYEGPTEWGGNLILDFSLFNWHTQPAVIVVESKLISGEYPLSPAEMAPTGGGANFSTYHVEIPATNVTSDDDSDYWVIAEVEGEDYRCEYTPPGPGGAPDATLAAFFRGGIYVSDVRYNEAPTVNSGVDGNDEPFEGMVETYTVDAVDPNGDPITYSWIVTDDATGLPVPGYDSVEGDGAGSLDVDFGAIGSLSGDEYDIDCELSDGINPPVSATTLSVMVWLDGDIWVSNNPDFASEPEYGTKDYPYHTINNALDSGYTAYDLIVVDYGIYSEQVYLYYAEPVELRGWNWYTTNGTRPVIEHLYGIPVYLRYSDNCTIRGFKIQYGLGTYEVYLMWNYYSNNTTVIDCFFTGETSSQSPYAVSNFYGNDFTFTNNKIAAFGTNDTLSYIYTTALFSFRGAGSHDICRNEITDIQPDAVTDYLNTYIMSLYLLPAGSEVSNNLIHHAAPTPGSGQNLSLYAMQCVYPYSTVEFAHNTIDAISLENSDYSYSSSYGMYVDDSGSTYTSSIHSNIVTRFHKYASSQYAYGIDCYDGSDYCDVWDFPMSGYRYYNAPEGPNSINADPLFVECDEEPYDYHLDTGSPCIGTGSSGEDMGCYGGLSPGQTVGLLTPE